MCASMAERDCHHWVYSLAHTYVPACYRKCRCGQLHELQPCVLCVHRVIKTLAPGLAWGIPAALLSKANMKLQPAHCAWSIKHIQQQAQVKSHCSCHHRHMLVAYDCPLWGGPHHHNSALRAQTLSPRLSCCACQKMQPCSSQFH